MKNVIYTAAGDQGIVMEFGKEINVETNKIIRGMVVKLRRKREVMELIPTFCSLLVIYDCNRTSFNKMRKLLEKELASLKITEEESYKVHIIPVCYEEPFNVDLQHVAEYAGISMSEVVELHSSREYLIYMLGFLPGFAYLGGLDKRIHCPRLDSPRVKIPAGSVGIGGEQTGIYPLDSPGGWQLIGRTPLQPYDPNRNPSILYEMGDYIRFKPISVEEYYEILRKEHRIVCI